MPAAADASCRRRPSRSATARAGEYSLAARRAGAELRKSLPRYILHTRAAQDKIRAPAIFVRPATYAASLLTAQGASPVPGRTMQCHAQSRRPRRARAMNSARRQMNTSSIEDGRADATDAAAEGFRQTQMMPGRDASTSQAPTFSRA